MPGEDLHQQVVRAGQRRALLLQLQPFAHRLRVERPGGGIVQHLPHPRREPARQRVFGAGIGRHHRVSGAALGHLHGRLAQPQEAQLAAGEQEGVAWAQHVGEALLDLAQREAATLGSAQPHLQHRRLDDGAGVHPRLPRHPLAADLDPALGVAEQLGVALVGGQRVAAVLDEAEHVVEVPPRQRRIGLRRAHLVVHAPGAERGAGRHQQQVLRQHVEPARPRRLAVQLHRPHAGDRRLALQHLEAVGRHQDRVRRLVHAVVGAPHPLQQPRHALGRPDLDHLVDAAPVDAEVERGGGDHAAQAAQRPRPARHRRLDPAALGDVQAAVMQRDRQRVLVDAPQRRKQQLGLRPGVDEHDGHAGRRDPLQDHRGAGQPHPPRPRHVAVGQQHRQRRRRPRRGHHHPRRRLRGADIGAQRLRVRHRRRQPDPARVRRQQPQPRQAEGELVAALGAGQRVRLVDDDPAQAAEHRVGVAPRQQQHQAFWRGEQDLRRRRTLPCPAVGRGVAGAGLDPDAEPHLLDRRREVAGDVGGERLQRADVEGMQAGEGVQAGRIAALCQLDQAGQEAGQGLAAAGGRHQQHVVARLRRRQHVELVLARRPAAAGEPAGEPLRQSVRRPLSASRHAEQIGRLERFPKRRPTDRDGRGRGPGWSATGGSPSSSAQGARIRRMIQSDDRVRCGRTSLGPRARRSARTPFGQRGHIGSAGRGSPSSAPLLRHIGSLGVGPGAGTRCAPRPGPSSREQRDRG